jgi:aerobic-type carbon monoxide dehydrogenase small subunit (CoxS/CutS family)
MRGARGGNAGAAGGQAGFSSARVGKVIRTPIYLRDELGLMGTKFGCGVGLCGACTVREGAKAIRSCVTMMSRSAGSEITTIEGLGHGSHHPVQKAWIRSMSRNAAIASPAR